MIQGFPVDWQVESQVPDILLIVSLIGTTLRLELAPVLFCLADNWLIIGWQGPHMGQFDPKGVLTLPHITFKCVENQPQKVLLV